MRWRRGGKGWIVSAVQNIWGQATYSWSSFNWSPCGHYRNDYVRANSLSERLFYELERVGLNRFNQIQSASHISVQSRKSALLKWSFFCLCLPQISSSQLSTFFKSNYCLPKKHTEKCFIPSRLSHCSPSFFLCQCFFTWMKNCPLFISPHILWFRQCWCLLSSFLALCQDPRNFFTLFHAPRQYHSRLSFKRPKRAGGKMQRLKLERIFVARELECGCAWVSWLNVRQSLLGLEDHPKEVGKCKSNHTWEDSLVLLLIYPSLSICVKTFTYQKHAKDG